MKMSGYIARGKCYLFCLRESRGNFIDPVAFELNVEKSHSEPGRINLVGVQ